MLATDADWATRVRWRFEGGRAVASTEWDIPLQVEAGVYRLLHSGFDPDGQQFRGESSPFRVERR